MSWLMARIYDRFMRRAEVAGLAAWRAELLSPLAGSGLEIGAGTGANLRHYGSGVEQLTVTEPDRHMRAQLLQRLAEARPDVEVSQAPVESLPFADDSLDFVVSTLVLCSVPDLGAALAEVRRVLRPGGTLAFLEHVASDRPDRLRWQRRIEPVWVHVSDGCHLTRETHLEIERAGFQIETLTRQSMRKALPFVRPSVRGVARKR